MKKIFVAFALLVAVAGGIAIVSSAQADDSSAGNVCASNKC